VGPRPRRLRLDHGGPQVLRGVDAMTHHERIDPRPDRRRRTHHPRSGALRKPSVGVISGPKHRIDQFIS
jgi:hypothetical protein